MQLDLLQKELPRAPARKTSPKKAEPSMTSLAEEKADGAFKTISEAADFLGVPQHVLRFWESRFKQIKPTKLRGGRRYYRPEDMEILSTIKHLLYKQGFTIEGAKKALSAREKPAELVANNEYNQLAVIRQELIGLRDKLKPHVF